MWAQANQALKAVLSFVRESVELGEGSGDTLQREVGRISSSAERDKCRQDAQCQRGFGGQALHDYARYMCHFGRHENTWALARLQQWQPQ